jgi:DNA-binding transcriptional LysR family regulator
MNLNRLAYFAAVVDAGSFTRAAERLGIGTTLLIRTTRRVHPTEAGRTFHARCLQVLQQAEDAFDELAQAAAEPTGTLRIAAPNDYGTSAVVPRSATSIRSLRSAQPSNLSANLKRFV